MAERLWTISNVLSLARIVLIAPIVLLLAANDPAYTPTIVVLVVLAAATDLFDGLLARELNQVTEFGKIIDPLADKLAVVSVLFVLAGQGKLPMWLFGAAAARDAVLFAGGLYAKRKRGVLLQSNLPGKLAVTSVTALVIVAILNQGPEHRLRDGLLILSTALIALSFLVYAVRFGRLMGKNGIS